MLKHTWHSNMATAKISRYFHTFSLSISRSFIWFCRCFPKAHITSASARDIWQENRLYALPFRLCARLVLHTMFAHVATSLTLFASFVWLLSTHTVNVQIVYRFNSKFTDFLKHYNVATGAYFARLVCGAGVRVCKNQIINSFTGIDMNIAWNLMSMPIIQFIVMQMCRISINNIWNNKVHARNFTIATTDLLTCSLSFSFPHLSHSTLCSWNIHMLIDFLVLGKR